MFLGFFFGVNDNILATVASEISTTEMRAKSNALYYISWSFGQLYMVALNYIIFDDSDVGNWRLLIQITGVIMLAMCVYIYINVVESPRFLLLSGNVD
jgi:MFS family permease